MRRSASFVFLWAAVALLAAVPSVGWGPQGHDIVTSKAISLLPDELRPFYERNERMVVALALMPDLWRDTHREEERAHHFIDLDLYGTPPGFEDLPRSRKAAERKFGELGMHKQGLLPWAIEWRYGKLARAIRKKDLAGIVVQSALLSHYVADAHVPFHATKDYDGRKPEQKGLHGRFESGLVGRSIGPQDIRPPAPVPSDKVLDAAFDWLVDAYQALDIINSADEAARAEAGGYNDAYYERFSAQAKPIAARQLEKAASNLAGLYIAAWNAAGRPKLEPKAVPLFWGK